LRAMAVWTTTRTCGVASAGASREQLTTPAATKSASTGAIELLIVIYRLPASRRSVALSTRT
jgi:hypothetical protein